MHTERSPNNKLSNGSVIAPSLPHGPSAETPCDDTAFASAKLSRTSIDTTVRWNKDWDSDEVSDAVVYKDFLLVHKSYCASIGLTAGSAIAGIGCLFVEGIASIANGAINAASNISGYNMSATTQPLLESFQSIMNSGATACGALFLGSLAAMLVLMQIHLYYIFKNS